MTTPIFSLIFRVFLARIHPKDPDASILGDQNAEEVLEQGRLPAAIGAQDTHPLSLIHDKFQAADLDLGHIRVDMGDAVDLNDSFICFIVLLSPVMNPVFKPPEHHGLMHLFAVIDPFQEEMAEGIRDIGHAPPRMSPLKPSPEVKGMFRLLQHLQKDKNGSISQKKGRHKKGREKPPQDTKDEGIRRRCQKQNNPR